VITGEFSVLDERIFTHPCRCTADCNQARLQGPVPAMAAVPPFAATQEIV
jgi:hypothetical protein